MGRESNGANGQISHHRPGIFQPPMPCEVQCSCALLHNFTVTLFAESVFVLESVTAAWRPEDSQQQALVARHASTSQLQLVTSPASAHLCTAFGPSPACTPRPLYFSRICHHGRRRCVTEG